LTGSGLTTVAAPELDDRRPSLEWPIQGCMAKKQRGRKAPKVCPVCGEDVPPHALACPECGADHNSGWREDSLDGMDLPDDEFDYNEFVREEFGTGPRPRHVHPVWWITAIILLIALLRYFLH
jgi:hypothetical protein